MPGTITIWTVTVVGDNEDSTSVSLHPSEPAALGHLRELFDLPEWIDNDAVVEAVNDDPVIAKNDELRFVMVDHHTYYL